MVKLTMVSRLSDGMPLAEGLDNEREQRELEQYKVQAKAVVKQLAAAPPSQQAPRMSFESGPYVLHYLIANGVCYITVCDKSYPKKLAFQYLDELQREFDSQFHTQIESVARPYAFVKFDTFIQKTKKLYLDTRTQRNLSKLNEDLADIQQVMTRNIQDALGMGERLDQVSMMSSALSSESKKYAGKSKDLARQALIKKYLPLGVLALVAVLVLWYRFG
mmetsp:Transcript_11679/g.42694  ORF Transcript_11679/g.42694 Transcript_11679/m.42694 type:complete len:219 (-) Transcript_11679:221-877(-)